MSREGEEGKEKKGKEKQKKTKSIMLTYNKMGRERVETSREEMEK